MEISHYSLTAPFHQHFLTQVYHCKPEADPLLHPCCLWHVESGPFDGRTVSWEDMQSLRQEQKFACLLDNISSASSTPNQTCTEGHIIVAQSNPLASALCHSQCGPLLMWADATLQKHFECSHVPRDSMLTVCAGLDSTAHGSASGACCHSESAVPGTQD